MTSKKCLLDFVLGDSNMEVEKKRPREPSEPGDDVSEGRRSEGRRSTTPEPAKKKKKVDPVCSFTKKINLTILVNCMLLYGFESSKCPRNLYYNKYKHRNYDI